MDTARIAHAVGLIDKNVAALKWLEQYGKSLDGRSQDSFTVAIRLHTASACPGASEAAEIMQSFARLSIADLVQTSITNCRNTIECAESIIREEAAKGPSL